MQINYNGVCMNKELNEYLNEWQTVKLSAIADIRFSSVNKVSQPGEEPVRLCNYTDVYKNDYVITDMDFMRATATNSEIKRFGLQVGDVIITKDSETPDDIGIPTVVDTTAPDLVCGYHLALLRLNQEEVDPTFLAKQLTHHRIVRYFGQQANGTTRYGLSTAAIANAPLNLPKPESQRYAGALLRMADNLTAQTEQVIDKLKQVRAGMLHDMLSYGLDEHGQLRDPITHPEQFKDSPLGRIPKEWIFGPLSRFVPKAEYGISSCLGENGVPVLRMNNISGGEAQLSDLKYSSAHIPDRLWLRPGDVLFNRTNSWEHVGRTGIWRGQIERTTFASYLVRLNNNPDLLNSELLNLWLNWPMIQIAIRRFATPAVQQVNINPTNLRQVQAAFPKNINEQNEIVVRIGQQDSAIRSLLAENIKLKSIKFGFQDDLLTARVRVPETVSFQESKL
jgi:type I restriction enzyme, S subunit